MLYKTFTNDDTTDTREKCFKLLLTCLTNANWLILEFQKQQ